MSFGRRNRRLIARRGAARQNAELDAGPKGHWLGLPRCRPAHRLHSSGVRCRAATRKLFGRAGPRVSAQRTECNMHVACAILQCQHCQASAESPPEAGRPEVVGPEKAAAVCTARAVSVFNQCMFRNLCALGRAPVIACAACAHAGMLVAAGTGKKTVFRIGCRSRREAGFSKMLQEKSKRLLFEQAEGQAKRLLFK